MGWVILAGVSAGVVCLLYALYLHQQGTQAASWPATEATITHVSIKHTGLTGGGNDGMRRNWFLPVVRYRYRVGARDYESERIVPGEVANDPRNPAYAVLEARADSGAITTYALTGIIALVGAVWLKFG